ILSAIRICNICVRWVRLCFVWNSASGLVLPPGSELGGDAECDCLGRVFTGYDRHDFWQYLFRYSTCRRVLAATDRVTAGPLSLLFLIPPVNEHDRARSRAGLLVGKAHFFTS